MRGNSSPNTIIATGLGFAIIGLTGRFILRRIPHLEKNVDDLMRHFLNVDSTPFKAKTCEPKIDNNLHYYKGGFDPKMNTREASLILGVNPSAKRRTIKAAFLRMMALNHPDRGGSPYLASKINEAKDFLESRTSASGK